VSRSNKSTQRLVRRIAHSIKDEIRLDILRILSERATTPRDLAEILGEEPSSVLSHVIELWAESCIEVVAEDESIEDAADRRYRTTPPFFLDDWEAQEISLEEREWLSVAVLQGIVTEALAAQRTGSLGSRHDSHLSYKALKLDERGWREFVALLLRTLKEAETIEEGSRDRLGLAGAEAIEAVVALMGFERSESRAR
jgi:DNA-binding transcriptional ArsR family regulator